MSNIQVLTRTIDNLITSTWYDIKPGLVDTVFKVTPVFDKLLEKGRIRAKVPDGEHFEIPFEYAKNDQNTQYFDRGSEFGTAEKEFMSNLVYYTRNLGAGIIRYEDDDRKNRGKAKLQDYADRKVENTIKTLIDKFNTDLIIQNGDSRSINAIETLVAEDPTTGTLGNLSRSGSVNLQNQYKDCVGLTTTTSLIDEMERMTNLCSEYKGGGRSGIDLIITSRKLYQDYKRIARAMGTLEFNSTPRADLGVGKVTFNGVEMFYDPSVPDDRMYFLNTDTLEFYYDPMAWFEMTPWKWVAGNRLDRTAQVVCVGNLVLEHAPKNGVLFNWTPVTS